MKKDLRVSDIFLDFISAYIFRELNEAEENSEDNDDVL